MSEGDAFDLLRAAIWTIIVGAGPSIGAAMAVGLAIALLQALTQVQEMTLTFVPKIAAIFVVGGLTAAWVGAQFDAFTLNVYARIERGFDR